MEKKGQLSQSSWYLDWSSAEGRTTGLSCGYPPAQRFTASSHLKSHCEVSSEGRYFKTSSGVLPQGKFKEQRDLAHLEMRTGRAKRFGQHATRVIFVIAWCEAWTSVFPFKYKMMLRERVWEENITKRHPNFLCFGWNDQIWQVFV